MHLTAQNDRDSELLYMILSGALFKVSQDAGCKFSDIEIDPTVQVSDTTKAQS